MSIEDRLGNKAESWIAEPGDKMRGTIVALSTLEGDYGPYPYVEIKEAGTGTYYGWHAFDTVAKNELAKGSPAVGDEIGLFYFGVQKTKPGSKYESFKNWQVIVEKPDGGSGVDVPDWNQVANDAAAEGIDEFGATVDGDGEPF